MLQPRFGIVGALFCSTGLFIIYHYGALPITWLTLIEVTSMSLLLGLIYIQSGSLLMVAAIHSIYDGIWFFGPFLSSPPANVWPPAFLISALALVAAWWRLGADFGHSLERL